MESPEYHRQVAEQTISKAIGIVSTHHRGAIGRAFAISALGSITYYVGITYVPAFMTSAGSLSEEASLWLSTIAAVVVILVTPFVGALSDRQLQTGAGPARHRKRLASRDDVLAHSQRLSRAGADRGARPRGACWRGQRSRRRRNGRTVSGRGSSHWTCAGSDDGDGNLRRPDPMSRSCSSKAPAGRWHRGQ